MKKYFTIIILVTICLTGCKTKDAETNAADTTPQISDTATSTPTPSAIPTVPVTPTSATTITPSGNQNTIKDKNDQLKLTLYVYGPDDYENPVEKKIITVSKKLYKCDLTKALNILFEETGIQFNHVKINKKKKCITVDISEEIAALKFNAGSTAGQIYTNELFDTLLNLPGVKKAIATVDGQKDYEADHFSFHGIFTKELKGKSNVIIAR